MQNNRVRVSNNKEQDEEGNRRRAILIDATFAA